MELNELRAILNPPKKVNITLQEGVSIDCKVYKAAAIDMQMAMEIVAGLFAIDGKVSPEQVVNLFKENIEEAYRILDGAVIITSQSVKDESVKTSNFLKVLPLDVTLDVIHAFMEWNADFFKQALKDRMDKILALVEGPKAESQQGPDGLSLSSDSSQTATPTH